MSHSSSTETSKHALFSLHLQPQWKPRPAPSGASSSGISSVSLADPPPDVIKRHRSWLQHDVLAPLISMFVSQHDNFDIFTLTDFDAVLELLISLKPEYEDITFLIMCWDGTDAEVDRQLPSNSEQCWTCPFPENHSSMLWQKLPKYVTRRSGGGGHGSWCHLLIVESNSARRVRTKDEIDFISMGENHKDVKLSVARVRLPPSTGAAPSSVMGGYWQEGTLPRWITDMNRLRSTPAIDNAGGDALSGVGARLESPAQPDHVSGEAKLLQLQPSQKMQQQQQSDENDVDGTMTSPHMPLTAEDPRAVVNKGAMAGDFVSVPSLEPDRAAPLPQRVHDEVRTVVRPPTVGATPPPNRATGGKRRKVIDEDGASDDDEDDHRDDNNDEDSEEDGVDPSFAPLHLLSAGANGTVDAAAFFSDMSLQSSATHPAGTLNGPGAPGVPLRTPDPQITLLLPSACLHWCEACLIPVSGPGFANHVKTKSHDDCVNAFTRRKRNEQQVLSTPPQVNVTGRSTSANGGRSRFVSHHDVPPVGAPHAPPHVASTPPPPQRSPAGAASTGPIPAPAPDGLGQFHCHVCDAPVCGELNWSIHLGSDRHKRKAELNSLGIRDPVQGGAPPAGGSGNGGGLPGVTASTGFAASMNATFFRCDVCGVTICGSSNYRQHLDAKEHKKRETFRRASQPSAAAPAM